MRIVNNPTFQNAEIKCPKCEMYSDCEYISFIDGTEDIEDKNRVFTSSAFYHECPYCGERMYFKLPFVYTNFIRNFSIVLTYDKENSEKFISNYKKAFLEKIDKENLDYIANHKFICVNDYKDLIEKVTILERGLDDRIIEIEKLLNWGSLNKEERSKESCKIYFSAQNGTYYFIAYSDDGLIERIPFKFEEYQEIKHTFITDEKRPFIVDKQYAIKKIDEKI